MKYCKRCDKNKDLSEFNKDKCKKDGLYNYCRECVKKTSVFYRIRDKEKNNLYACEYRKKNRVKLRENWRERFRNQRDKCLRISKESYYRNKEQIAKRRKIRRSTPKGRLKENERQRKWRSENGELYRSYIRKWRLDNRIKVNAHAKVHRAVANGTLKRSQTCKECGIKCKTEGHHDDYTKPLKVKWLCRKCHASKLEVIEV